MASGAPTGRERIPRRNAKIAVLGAEAWIILQRTELPYVGEGEIRKRICRLVRICGEEGVAQASLALPSMGGKTSRINSLWSQSL